MARGYAVRTGYIRNAYKIVCIPRARHHLGVLDDKEILKFTLKKSDRRV
jgi:hypothetical protein